jgi:hypothetical protein
MNDRYSAAERAAILRQYERSGLDLEVFAAWAAIPFRRLRGWLRRERPAEAPSLDWMEVELCATERSQEAERC